MLIAAMNIIPVHVILYIEDVDLNVKELELPGAFTVILYIEDVDLNTLHIVKNAVR